MERFNLWVTLNGHSKVVCYGSLCDLNTIAIAAGLPGDIHVLPDGQEPNQPATLPLQCEPQ